VFTLQKKQVFRATFLEPFLGLSRFFRAVLSPKNSFKQFEPF